MSRLSFEIPTPVSQPPPVAAAPTMALPSEPTPEASQATPEASPPPKARRKRRQAPGRRELMVFFGLPVALVIEDMLSKISAGALKVFLIICRHFGRNDSSWPGRRTLCRDSKLGDRRVGEVLTELRQGGWIVDAEPVNGQPAYALGPACEMPSLAAKRSMPSEKTRKNTSVEEAGRTQTVDFRHLVDGKNGGRTDGRNSNPPLYPPIRKNKFRNTPMVERHQGRDWRGEEENRSNRSTRSNDLTRRREPDLHEAEFQREKVRQIRELAASGPCEEDRLRLITMSEKEFEQLKADVLKDLSPELREKLKGHTRNSRDLQPLLLRELHRRRSEPAEARESSPEPSAPPSNCSAVEHELRGDDEGQAD